ncbi:MAG: ABC transporter permease [Rothia sp. (in: high G+C Gram-positive bacteria)]|uniref:ABC transporter permease n=1 Tax=Rothia sp. (in: high G+C Gram-positive bacteria) TaxID=1885016 RepID=UPI0026DFCEBC|nr:ABC transporter permease [Rothia sp. (in: high G+C Gram-positive bacteria)]MDO5750055.1 ABC transporter permease [Rothia sp. (in: high G+C Gram-positive bacteria)]
MLRYTYYEILRTVLNKSALFSFILMPVAFYLLFGAMQSSSSFPMHDGTVGTYVMIGMAIYGAVLSATALSGNMVTELQSGWARTLGLTPLRFSHYLASKIITALCAATLSVTAVFGVGVCTGTKIPPPQLLGCAAVIIFSSLLFVLYGMVAALIIPGENAVSIAIGLVVMFAMFGTLFVPLPETLMPWARYTPLYGMAQLARRPFTNGDIIYQNDEGFRYMTESLGAALANYGAWLLIFTVLLALLWRRRATVRR